MGIIKKLYEDYFKPSRLAEYEEVLKMAKDKGYKMVSILDFYNMTKIGGGQAKLSKVLINRHDIDTSSRVARNFFDIEKRVYGQNGTATYYFRDSTVDKNLIHDIDAYGYETGYHYENISKCLKKYHIKSKDGVSEILAEARQEFLKDLHNFRNITGSRSLTVSSHGDFTNVAIGVSNRFLMDLDVRKQADIILEAYDDIIEQSHDVRFADQLLLGRFASQVEDAIGSEIPIIMILTHPRNWEVDLCSNTKENLRRMWQGIMW